MNDDKPDSATVAIPGGGVDNGIDICKPTTGLLGCLSLLPGTEEMKKAGGFEGLFKGPPDSVALIEAGATSASKWWATGLAGGSVFGTGIIVRVWDGLGASNQPVMLFSLGVVLAAAALGIAILLASDVRGRAAVMVATVEARREVATTMVRQAGASFQGVKPSQGSAGAAGLSLHGSDAGAFTTAITPTPVDNGLRLGNDEKGWLAIAVREQGGERKFLLVKGATSEWIPSDKVQFPAI